MTWYDVFAGFYDASLEKLYRPCRQEAARALQLGPEHTVLDLACGTGQNLPVILASGCRVVGVDFSEGMLARARRRVEVGQWGDRVTLLQRDARLLTAADLGVAPDRMICTLGLSVIPDWEAVLLHTLSVLAPGARVAVIDVFMERWVPQSTVVRWMAQADLDRRIWEVLERELDGFELRVLEDRPHVHGGQLWLATGTVREAAG